MTYSGLTNQAVSTFQQSDRRGTKIDTFLIHHQAGTNDDAVIREMVTGSREVSANYTISNEGRLTSVVPEELRAWTSGSSSDGGKGAAWDRRAITVEIEDQTGAPDWIISDAALKTAAALLQDLRHRYGVSIVLGHRDLWNIYRASYATYCPGPNTVAQIVALAGGAPVVLPSVGSTPASSGYDYVGGASSAAWLGLQHWLAANWGYTGILDGIPGRLTWTALQKYLAAHWAYKGAIDGEPGKLSWGACQRWLAANYGYTGAIDGIPGPLTAASLGRAGAALGGGAVPTPPPAGLPHTVIDGIPGPITWRRGQTWLHASWGYTGPIDGIPGPMTYKALQRYLASAWHYTGRIDGIPGKLTYGAMQRWLRADWGYTGAIDGIPGKMTWSAFQRFVNTV